MKKVLITLLIIVTAFATFAQKVKIKVKKGVVSVDGISYAKWERDDIVRYDSQVKNLSNDLLLLAKFKRFIDPKAVSKANPNGSVSYYEITKPGQEEVLFEITSSKKIIFQTIYAAKVINSDGTLNDENLNTLAKRLGKDYSRQRSEL